MALKKQLALLAVSVLASTGALSQAAGAAFVLNDAKPYVYLELDHVGSRKAMQEGEPSTGIWLRIVNNCRVPIQVGTFGGTTGEPGVGVLDEVVPVEGPKTIRIVAGVAGPDGPVNETSPSPDLTAMPEGYWAEVHSLTRVASGKSLLFSVPINHVGKGWFLRVRFTLDVSNDPRISASPYSYVDFYGLPPEFHPTTPNHSASGSLNHEGGHVSDAEHPGPK